MVILSGKSTCTFFSNDNKIKYLLQMPIYTDETNADKIIGNIWLGNHLASKDVDFLKHNDIMSFSLCVRASN